MNKPVRTFLSNEIAWCGINLESVGVSQTDLTSRRCACNAGLLRSASWLAASAERSGPDSGRREKLCRGQRVDKGIDEMKEDFLTNTITLDKLL